MTEKRAIREMLLELAEPEYARFAASLLRKPGEEQPSGSAAHVLGVRLPVLRKLAKKLAKEDWQGYIGQLSGQWQAAEPLCFEEIMLWGFLVGAAPKSVSLQEQFSRIRRFVPAIDNWSLCDSFCAGLAFPREYPAQTWDFLQEFLQSEETYAVRFGVVLLLDYFITDAYIDRLFPIFDRVKQDDYYVKMAVAWAVSICYVRFPQKTEGYLANNQLDDFTYKKALQKITESRCVDAETKRKIRAMKR